MPTFKDLYSHLNLIASEEDGDDFQVMAKREINFTYREILAEGDSDLERREFTLTTVSGISKYGMPIYVSQVLNIEDDTNDRSIPLRGPHEFDRNRAGLSESGTPLNAYWFGEYGVQKQPASAGKISVVSSSTSDASGGNFNIIVNGMSSGVDIRESIEMNGTTEVESSASFDAVSNGIGIRRLVLSNASSAEFSGYVTVKDVSDNTLAVIPPYWGKSPSYQWWEFDYTPDTAMTYVVRCLAQKPPLINDDDWPEIPEEYHDLLVLGPEAILLAGKGKESASAAARQKYQVRKEAYLGRKQHKGVRSRSFRNVSNRYISRGSGEKIPNASNS